jgi:hypothetical protein
MSTHHHETGSSGLTPYAGGGSPSVVRRWHDPSGDAGGGPAASDVTGREGADVGEAMRPGGALDALVDAVVERVEQRVIDELERRGRRQSWASF